MPLACGGVTSLSAVLTQGKVWVALRRHGPLVLFLVGFFGWVDALPLYGSVSAAWAGAHRVAFAPLPLWFLAAHAPALVIWGAVWDRYPRWAARGSAAAVAACAVFTLLLLRLPAAGWPWLFAAMGVAAGAAMPAWGRWYAVSVATPWLGRIFAVAAAGVDALVWLFGDLVRVIPVEVALVLTLAPLVLAALVVNRMPSPVEERAAAGPWTRSLPGFGPVGVARYAFFIVLFSVVAGFSYRFFSVAPLTPYVDESLRRLPYLVGVLAAGVLADRKGLLWALVGGTAMLAVAFLIGAWGEPDAQYLGIVLNGGAFGLLEQAPWLLTAVVVTPATAARGFGLGLNLNVIPIFLGGWATGLLHAMSPARLGLLAAVVLMVAILSLQGVQDPLVAAKAQEQTPPPASPERAEPATRAHMPIDALLALRFGGELTSRELEIGKLAVLGVSTRDIAGRLIISENTVKTHLRNVYRKTASANRSDLLRKILHDGDEAVSGSGLGG